MAKATLERRGRRVLLWGVVFFFAIQQLAGFLMDYNWQELRFPSLAYVLGKWRNTHGQADIILFGSSRFGGLDMAAVHKGCLDGGAPVQVFNASMGAGDLVTSEYMLRELMHRGARPKWVVLEVSPETVTHYNRWILEHLRRQLTWKDLPRFLPDICRNGQMMRLIQARFLPLYMHRHTIWNSTLSSVENYFPATLPVKPKETRPDLQPVREHGHHEQALTFGGLMVEVPVWLRHYQAGGGTSEVALERLLSRCRKRGIRVLLLGVPVSSAHRSLYTPEIDTEFKKYIAHFVASDFCTFFDYRDQVPDSMFLDHHHLSFEGAAYFGRRLGMEVLAPQMANEPGLPAGNGAAK